MRSFSSEFVVIFLSEWLFIVAVTMLFAVIGGFAIIPFRRAFRYAILLAPMFGLLVGTLGALAFYVFFKAPFQLAFLISAAGCIMMTIFSTWHAGLKVAPRNLGIPFGLLLVFAAVTTLTLTATTLQFGSPSILYTDGTDHVAYTHTARWMLENRITQFIRIDQDDPFQTWIYPAFVADTRSIAFSFTGIISMLTGITPFFAFDLTCAVVMTAGVLATAGAFGQRPLIVIFLIAGLFTSHWFDYSRSGYFGKLMCYPAMFSLVAIVMASLRERVTLLEIALLSLLTFAVSLAITGTVAAFYLVMIGMTYLVMNWILDKERQVTIPEQLPTQALLVIFLAGVAICSSGMLSRPMELRFPVYDLTWPYILGRMLDLDSQGISISGYSANGLWVAIVLGLAIPIVLAIIAVRRRNALASTLFIAPLLQIAVTMSLGARGTAFQQIGTFHPLWLCGTAVLLNDISGRDIVQYLTQPAAKRFAAYTSILVVVLALIEVGLRVPRFIGGLDRWAGGSTTAVIQQFVKSQFDAIEAAVGKETVDVDIPGPTHALAVLTELRRRGLNLQWEPSIWNLIRYGRDVPPPKYPQSGTYRLRMISEPVDPSAETVMTTNQFRLLKTRRAALPNNQPSVR